MKALRLQRFAIAAEPRRRYDAQPGRRGPAAVTVPAAVPGSSIDSESTRSTRRRALALGAAGPLPVSPGLSELGS
jgi:hypothetical protein